ncbi:unnamed protein product [Meloidogyne enterolobii]|uniref:Uncharacterized protein n=1 Tax=Meloidogyne enterolobii TaxID=390850 RepID=A0ACB1ASF2_MELEN
MLYCKLTVILLHLLLLILISGKSSDSNNDCSCLKEQIFDSNVKDGNNSNFKILNEKNDSVQFTFDGVKCNFLDCYWEIQPPKDSKLYHYIIVKMNLSHPDDGDFVEECDTNFRTGSRGCSRYNSKNIGSSNEILVNDVSRFILKRDASVRVWYHRESVGMIKNPNIPRQFNLNYEWREEPHPLMPKKSFNDI